MSNRWPYSITINFGIGLTLPPTGNIICICMSVCHSPNDISRARKLLSMQRYLTFRYLAKVQACPSYERA